MNKHKSPVLQMIDTGQLAQFKAREKKRISIPECILEEYSLTPSPSMPVNSDIMPLKQYQEAEAYLFSWGHILERRTDKYIVWDFCFNSLLIQYHRAGKRLKHLQNSAYHYLESQMSCTTRDIVPVLSMEEGWKIIPCSSVGAFTLVMHFSQETEAREWIAYDLLTVIMPKLIEELQRGIR